MRDLHDSVTAVQWRNDALYLLDQRYLPLVSKYYRCDDVADVVQAITDMVVRGAPAIGVTAAYGVVLAARNRYRDDPHSWKEHTAADLEQLARSRPTAVNLHWALERMHRRIDAVEGDPQGPLLVAARQIHDEDVAGNCRMGVLGAALITEPGAVLTHCNAGALATGGFGTALGVIREAFRCGKVHRIYADETRPWLQGARLTAWELLQDGIPVTLVVEGAAAHLLSQGEIRWVIVGADRIAANGDAANKIGTYGLAVLARHHNVKMMVVAPTSTVDMSLASGAGIPVEQRSEHEILSFQGNRIAAVGAEAWNPVFDVTPAHLIDVIVTEKGVVCEPDADKMRAMMAGRICPPPSVN